MSEQELGEIVQITVDEFNQEDRTGKSDLKRYGHPLILSILRFTAFITITITFAFIWITIKF